MRERSGTTGRLRRSVTIIVAMGAALGVSSASLAVTIDIYASPAVNRFHSPTWGDWIANAKDSLNNDLGDVGNPATDPDAYYTVDAFETTDIAVTTFESWKGVAPGANPFHEEHGQRLHFPIIIESETGIDDIKLNNIGNLGLYFLDTDQSPTEVTIFNFANNPFGGYDAHFIGVKANGNIIDSGENPNTLVNKLIYVSLGMAWADDDPAMNVPINATNQATLNALLADLGDGSVKHIRATMNYLDGGNVVASAELQVNFVPEPSTMALLGLGMLAVLGVARRGSR